MNTIIGKNLKALREFNQFSQEQVADFLGLNRSTYANYEIGIREVPLHVLEKCTHLYGCDLTLLFEENEANMQDALVCAFRVDDLSVSDMEEVAHFKEIVKNYLKIDYILQHGTSLI